MRATAPGKVLWAGEYAVLDGATAVITAVDRRVIAAVGARPIRLSPFLTAARDEIVARFGPTSRAALAAVRVRVDSRPLAARGRKLGLGSSAASTVAAIAAALGTEDLALIHELAHAAHARAQAPRGSRGSGADIAASVHGGTLAVHRTGDGPLAVEPLPWPPGLDFALVWTGAPADTPSLVARVRALREHDAAGHAQAIGAIAGAAERMAAGFRGKDAAAVVSAVAEGGVALGDLGHRAGTPLVPDGFDVLDALARAHGGAAKPTGAGGGDLILAVFAGDAAPFRAALAERGMIEVTARVDPRGVALAEPAGTT